MVSDPDGSDNDVEARLRIALSLGQVATWDWDLTTNALSWSEDYYALLGYRVGEVQPGYAAWAARIHPDDIAASQVAILAARDARKEYVHTMRKQRPDGSVRWCIVRGVFLYDADGRAVRMIGAARDITDARAAEHVLRESEARMRTLVEGVPQLVWRAAAGGGWTWSSPQWTAFTGLSCAASYGEGWLRAVHPEDRERARASWAVAGIALDFAADYRLFNIGDGGYRWFQTRAAPRYGDDGAIVEWLGTSTDVDDLRQLREHERRLRGELQHRVRNTLAMVRAIVRRTAESVGAPEDFHPHLDARLAALARTQSHVIRDPWGGVDFRSIIIDELMAHLVAENERVTIAGPTVHLPPRIAELVSLGIHELVTNALKFGALAEVGGRLRIGWTTTPVTDRDADTIDFTWAETCTFPVASESGRRGFGLELFDGALANTVPAETTFVLTPTGAIFTARFSVPRGQAPANRVG